MHDIWAKYADQWGLDWREESMGMGPITIGHVADRPICVTVWWAHIGTKRVAFVEGTSQLVDYEMLEDWSREVFPNAKAWSNKTNFGNLVSAICQEIGVLSLYKHKVELVDFAKISKPNPDYLAPRKK